MCLLFDYHRSKEVPEDGLLVGIVTIINITRQNSAYLSQYITINEKSHVFVLISYVINY